MLPTCFFVLKSLDRLDYVYQMQLSIFDRQMRFSVATDCSHGYTVVDS